MSDLVRNIRILMAFKGLTQKELAKESGLTQASISNILNQKCEPLLVSLKALAEALDSEVRVLTKSKIFLIPQHLPYFVPPHVQSGFAFNLRLLMASKGYNANQLSKALQVSQMSVHSYLTGNHLPSIVTLVKIKELLNVDYNMLLGKIIISISGGAE